MTIKDPEIIKRVQEANAKRKAEFGANRGKKQGRTVIIMVCKACKSNVGTFQWVTTRDDRGRPMKVMVHVNCPKRK